MGNRSKFVLYSGAFHKPGEPAVLNSNAKKSACCGENIAPCNTRYLRIEYSTSPSGNFFPDIIMKCFQTENDDMLK